MFCVLWRLFARMVCHSSPHTVKYSTMYSIDKPDTRVGSHDSSHGANPCLTTPVALSRFPNNPRYNSMRLYSEILSESLIYDRRDGGKAGNFMTSPDYVLANKLCIVLGGGERCGFQF